MTEDWKKQMQQKMADYRESDIDVSWEEIEQALDANRKQALDANKKQARVVPLWTKRVAAAAVILLIAGGGYWMLQEQRADAPETSVAKVVKTPQSGSVAQAIASLKDEAAQTVVTPEKDIAQMLQNVMAQQHEEIPEREVTPQPIATTEPEATTQASASQAETTPPAEKTAASPTPTQQHQASSTPTHQHQASPAPTHHQTIYPSDLRRRTAPSNRLTAKVYLSNTMASANSLSFDYIQGLSYNNQNGNTNFNGGEDGKDGKNGSDGTTTENVEDGKDGVNGEYGEDDLENMDPAYKTVQTAEKAHHHQPIRFGFSLRYRFDDRWSVESGLTYTRLSADITNTVDGQTTATEQRLNYIGIPFNVQYLMWGSRYVNVYVAAGGLVEKMVKGSRTTQGTSNSVSIHPLQVSVNGALGAEFKFTEGLSLYAEPALNYYFDNHSAIPTFYQEKPLNFNLNLGLRFNLK
ncbi:MAG: outer membrane beta-barrel protein [Prevotella sp.]|nr:outer membrane beta-barrel protein [Prevotella sp.]